MEEDTGSSRIRKNAVYMSAIFFFCIFLIVCEGFYELARASTYIEPAMWGGGNPPEYIIDYVGLEIELEFFYYRNIAAGFLLVAIIVYPIWMGFDQYILKKPLGNLFDIGLILGLLIPSVFIYGNPAGTYRDLAPSNFELTGVVSPFFNFIFTGQFWLDTEISISGFRNPFALLGSILLGFAILQILALKAFENNRIGIKLYLIPIIVNVLFLWSLLVTGFPSPLVTDYIVSPSGASIAELCIPVPMFSIAILIRGLNRKRLESI